MALGGRCRVVEWCSVLLRVLWYRGVNVGKRSRSLRGYGRDKSQRGVEPCCTKVGECHGSMRARGGRKQTFLTSVRVEGAVSSPRFLADSCEWE